MRTITCLLVLLTVLLNQLEAKVAHAQEGTASNQPAPAPASVPGASAPSASTPSASTPTESQEPSVAAPSVTPALTPDAAKPEARSKPPQVKWRPLVLRSEIPPDERPIFGSFKGTYVMAGANVGLGLTQTALLLGGEVSIVHQTTEFAWFGAYIDGVRDFGRDQTRFSIGPEIGWSAFGLDAGYLLLSTPTGVSHGATLRPLVSMGYVTVFGRFSKDLTTTSRVWSELGLLLKYPIEL